MIVYEGKLKGKDNQYRRLDEAIRTGLFIRNTCLRYWEDGHAKSRNDFSKYCTILGKSEEFPWAGKLNSQARQAMSERTWAAISRFFDSEKILSSPFNSVMDGSLSTSINDSWLSQSQDDLISMLLQDKRSPHTRAAYGKDLRNFFFVVANTPEPTPQIVVEFLSLDRFAAVSLVLKYKAFLLEQGLTPATVNRRLAAVKSLVKFARKIGRCSYSLEDIEGERNRAYRDTTGIDIKAFKRVLMECDRSTKKGLRDYAILHLLWSNALRRSEVVSLDVKDFEPNNKTLTILGKGQASRQVISISEATTQAILAWLNERNCVDPNAPLFVAVSYNKRGNRLTGEALRQLVCLYCKKAGISKQMSPHRIRHSSITHALDVTGDVRKVQGLSRHVKLETLMIYDDNRQNMQGEVSELLSDALE